MIATTSFLPLEAEPRAAVTKRRRVKGEARRQAIMDAAEDVFSERGYYGSSMREVATRSGAALGLIGHYFSTKEILFEEVIARRLPDLHNRVADSLGRSARKAPGNTRAIIKAFITPFLQACANDRDRLGTYIRMTSHFMSSYRVPEVAPALASLKIVSDLFADALRPTVPLLSDKQFEIGLYLVEAALIFMVQDTGFLDTLSAGDFDADHIDQLIDPTATFFAAGTAALAASPTA